MFPRMCCSHCDVYWLDLVDEPNCWVCGRPGWRTGETVMTSPGVHTYRHEAVEVFVAGIPVSVESAAAPW